MRRGPRWGFSLTAAALALVHVLEVEDLRDQQRGALLGFQEQQSSGPFQNQKICNSTSTRPRSAPKVLVGVRDLCGWEGRRAAPPSSSYLPHLACVTGRHSSSLSRSYQTTLKRLEGQSTPLDTMIRRLASDQVTTPLPPP
ncbi:uncharacterized protein SCHCODRAFT_01227124 [Schizophyllum commune H4-8]|uniref:Expressed protein n=1 Tax=Schizophyllum commune (strain H4-8 / FGSC 9210) TaxID=578458 RepID=D8PKY0_SCHCM|nr:uncharacterized protein SCHCODRAFT_01227124 [Schizophyllum commune H4-8]KAI5894236.1 hypothetical protein SCHCODRAFT_01227124 [Schizophyllum commune H4-8]